MSLHVALLSYLGFTTQTSIKMCFFFFPPSGRDAGTASHGGIPTVGVARGEGKERLMCNTLKEEGSPSCFVRGPADMGKHLLHRNRDWWLKLCAVRGSASLDVMAENMDRRFFFFKKKVWAQEHTKRYLPLGRTFGENVAHRGKISGYVFTPT